MHRVIVTWLRDGLVVAMDLDDYLAMSDEEIAGTRVEFANLPHPDAWRAVGAL